MSICHCGLNTWLNSHGQYKNNWIQVLALIQSLDPCYCITWSLAGDGIRTWGPATHMTDPEVSGSWLSLGPSPAVV